MGANRDIAPYDGTDRISYLQASDSQPVSASVAPGGQTRIGPIARIKFGKEINDHIFTRVRQDHITDETVHAAEAVSMTMLHGGRLRMQVAHQAGLFMTQYGPDSAAHAVALPVAQSVFDKTNRALDDLEEIFTSNTKTNMRRR